MSQLTILTARLAKVQARIADIEAAYPTLAKTKSYSQGFGEVSATYQDFGAVASEYARLLEQETVLQGQIDAINGTETGSSIAAFNGAQ